MAGLLANTSWDATLHGGQTAICADVEIDPEWQSLGDPAAEHGLRACWMTPVFGAEGTLIATIGVFYSHRYEPTRRELVLVLVQTAASLVAVAVTRECSDTAQVRERAGAEKHRGFCPLRPRKSASKGPRRIASWQIWRRWSTTCAAHYAP